MRYFTMALLISTVLLAACTPLELPPTLMPTPNVKTPPPPMPSPTLEPVTNLPAPIAAALAFLSKTQNLPLAEIALVSYEAVDWGDACLEIMQDTEACLAVITPGYRVMAQSGEQEYELHTDATGANIRLLPPQQPAPKPLLMWARSGGIAGVCQQLTVDTRGYFQLIACNGPETIFGAGQLPADLWDQLQNWQNAYADVDWQTTIPPGAADMFVDHLVLDGKGAETLAPDSAEALANTLSGWWATLPRTAPDFTQSGVEGVAMIGPACPGPQTTDPACADQPYPAKFMVQSGKGEALAEVHLEVTGTFRIALLPGEYTLVPILDTRYPLAAELTFKVGEGALENVTLHYDSGLR